VAGTADQDDGSMVSDYDEAVTIPATKMGLRIIGMGNSPEGILWTGDADATLLTINAKDCFVTGIRFRPSGGGSAGGRGIFLAKAVDLAACANGATIVNCIFRGTEGTPASGIHTDGANDVTVENCKFTTLVTGITQDATPNAVTYRMIIRNNLLDDKCTNGVIIDGRSCLIDNNKFAGSALTMIIQTNGVGAAGSYNIVRNHWFKVTAYETNCSGCATDEWWGNYCDDTSSSMVEATNAKYMTIGIPTA